MVGNMASSQWFAELKFITALAVNGADDDEGVLDGGAHQMKHKIWEAFSLRL